MVRTYKRPSTRQLWYEISMTKALEAVNVKEMGIKKAAAVFNVPITTLRRRARNLNKRVGNGQKDLGGRQPPLCKTLETDLVTYIIKMEEMFFGLTMEDVRKLAFQMAKRNRLVQETTKDTLDKDWLKGFLKRHVDISLRMPEATSAARARGFNRVIITKFFDIYESLMSKHHFLPIIRMTSTTCWTSQIHPRTKLLVVISSKCSASG